MRPSWKKRKILIIVAGIIILVFLNFYSSQVRNFFDSISNNLQESLWKKGIGFSNFWRTIAEIKNLEKQVGDLKVENQNLLSNLFLVKNLEDENKILREALDLGLRKDFKVVFVKVIGKDINQDYILINRGSVGGIKEGIAAITASKAILGRVSEVSESFSKVMLITHPESSLGGTIQEAEIQGIVKGKGSSFLSFGLVPKDKDLKEGQIVITTSLAKDIPAGLLAGQVKKITKSDIVPVQEGTLIPFFDLNSLENIFIITDF